MRGLSPRVRGKPQPRCTYRHQQRSIPACAGEAHHNRADGYAPSVYPRVCGGSVLGTAYSQLYQGLSPRVRGKPRKLVSERHPERSIPACAGEANCGGQRISALAVYPRVCGGSLLGRNNCGGHRGLSPRVRGKRRNQGHRITSTRSIPACAGEATPLARCAASSGVYPRVCGGSASALASLSCYSGLSPRVRGKPRQRVDGRTLRGSIPACAGEAADGVSSAMMGGVYPRVCGGSASACRS